MIADAGSSDQHLIRLSCFESHCAYGVFLAKYRLKSGGSVRPPYRTTLDERYLCRMNGFARKAKTLLILASLFHRAACRHQLFDDLRLSLFLQIGI